MTNYGDQNDVNMGDETEWPQLNAAAGAQSPAAKAGADATELSWTDSKCKRERSKPTCGMLPIE